MKLVWEHAETSGNENWKGLTWAMIPSHTSGICACTYHLFYNSPLLVWIVALQAALTVAGNSCLAVAAYRIFDAEKKKEDQELGTTELAALETPVNFEPKIKPLPDSDATFGVEMLVKSVLLSLLVKYGEIFFEFPFEAKSEIAALFIVVPTCFNIAKWSSRSKTLAT
jgi:hypothetical protein